MNGITRFWPFRSWPAAANYTSILGSTAPSPRKSRDTCRKKTDFRILDGSVAEDRSVVVINLAGGQSDTRFSVHAGAFQELVGWDSPSDSSRIPPGWGESALKTQQYLGIGNRLTHPGLWFMCGQLVESPIWERFREGPESTQRPDWARCCVKLGRMTLLTRAQLSWENQGHDIEIARFDTGPVIAGDAGSGRSCPRRTLSGR